MSVPHLRPGDTTAPFGEWVECSLADLITALDELKTGVVFQGTHDQTFRMRREQAEAVTRTHDYFHSIWKEDIHAVPRFLWNAKMRFGKTFTAYQLAKKLGATRVLVLTFKPAVEDAWKTDLVSHADFDGWQYLSTLIRLRSDPSRSRKARDLFRFIPGPTGTRPFRQYQVKE